MPVNSINYQIAYSVYAFLAQIHISFASCSSVCLYEPELSILSSLKCLSEEFLLHLQGPRLIATQRMVCRLLFRWGVGSHRIVWKGVLLSLLSILIVWIEETKSLQFSAAVKCTLKKKSLEKGIEKRICWYFCHPLSYVPILMEAFKKKWSCSLVHSFVPVAQAFCLLLICWNTNMEVYLELAGVLKKQN